MASASSSPATPAQSVASDMRVRLVGGVRSRRLRNQYAALPAGAMRIGGSGLISPHRVEDAIDHQS